jgi:SPX domain protein involved in polyphosphate accumulation
MNEFLDYDQGKKTIKSLNLDDFSVEDLDKYRSELKDEIGRVYTEKSKKI